MSRLPRRGGSWISRPRPWPVEWTKARSKPCRAARGARRRPLQAVARRRDGVDGGQAALRARRDTTRFTGRRACRGTTCASCRSRSHLTNAPMSITTKLPASERAAVGWACGSAERRPRRRWSRSRFSAPRRRMRYSISAARSRSVMPGRTRAAASSKARELVSTERRMRAISAGDFTMRSSSIQPFTGSSEAFMGRRDFSDS